MKTEVTVDQAGRLVLPKNFRNALGVSGRTSVLLEWVNNAVQISAPPRVHSPVSRKKGRLLYEGTLPEGWDSGSAILELRQRRLRR